MFRNGLALSIICTYLQTSLRCAFSVKDRDSAERLKHRAVRDVSSFHPFLIPKLITLLFCCWLLNPFQLTDRLAVHRTDKQSFALRPSSESPTGMHVFALWVVASAQGMMQIPHRKPVGLSQAHNHHRLTAATRANQRYQFPDFVAIRHSSGPATVLTNPTIWTSILICRLQITQQNQSS